MSALKMEEVVEIALKAFPWWAGQYPEFDEPMENEYGEWTVHNMWHTGVIYLDGTTRDLTDYPTY